MPVNPPDRLRLLDAVIELLGRDRSAETSGRANYQARIAVSLLALIRRELALGDDLDDHERARLVQLVQREGDTTSLNAALCSLIRSRALDIGAKPLLDHLRLTTLGKLAIDNPRYSAYLRDQQRPR